MEEIVSDAVAEAPAEAPAPVSEPAKSEPEAPAEKAGTFTQDDVDRIVRERLARERAKHSDVDELRAQAEKAAEAEKRIAALEAELTKSKAVSEAAAKAGITNPDDVRLFLTGADAETLEAQAKRLAEILSGSAKSHTVPSEGAVSTASAGASTSDFLRALTASH